jgi:hypothetical protein
MDCDSDSEAGNARFRFAGALSACNPWSLIESSAPVQTPGPVTGRRTSMFQATSRDRNRRFAVSTDLPDQISITAVELDILESLFGELIKAVLAGNPIDDPGTL